jgi:hypothetical protein
VWIRGPQGAVAFGLRVRPEPAPSLVEVTVDADADVPADRVRACAATLRRALSAQR